MVIDNIIIHNYGKSYDYVHTKYEPVTWQHGHCDNCLNSDFCGVHLVTSFYLQVALYHHIHFQAVAAVPKPPYFNFLLNFVFLRFSTIS